MIDIPGVTIRKVDELPPTLDGATQVGPFSAARPGALLRVVPGVGRFLARDGSTLEYSVEPHADPAAVEALLGGGVLGALIHQRGELPLHSTTLVSPERNFALALAGHSGAGKSTTAFELIRRGWIMLSDDLTRVTIEDGAPVAAPGRSRLRLLADACERFGIDTSSLTHVPNWPGKFAIGTPRWNEPLPLGALVALERTDAPFEIVGVTGAGAVRALAEQTYRIHYVAALGQTRRHLELVATTAAHVSVLRTRGRASVAEVADAVDAALTRMPSSPRVAT